MDFYKMRMFARTYLLARFSILHGPAYMYYFRAEKETTEQLKLPLPCHHPFFHRRFAIILEKRERSNLHE